MCVDEISCSFHDDLQTCFSVLRTDDYETKHLELLLRHLNLIFRVIVNEKSSDNLPPPDETAVACEISHRPGTFLSALIQSRLLNDLVDWAVPSRTPPTVAVPLVRLLLRDFNFLISQSKQCVLGYREIQLPFQRLLLSTSYEKVGPDFSHVLNSFCVLLCRDSELLKISKQVSLDVTGQEYFAFSLLVPMLHLPGVFGDDARSALLLILALSTRDPDVASYLTSKSDLCPVLATGLNALYSSLPKKILFHETRTELTVSVTSELHVYGSGWHRIAKEEWATCEPLLRFLDTLDFCNIAVRKSDISVQKCLLDYISSGFLLPVLGSALHQNSMDEVIVATAYLELFLRRLTEPNLIRLFLRFIISSRYETSSLLSSLVSRIDSKGAVFQFVKHSSNEWNQLIRVTLSLFRTILNLNCEDVMLELIYQYLNNLRCDPASSETSSPSSPLHPSKTFSTSSETSLPSEKWLTSADRFLGLTIWCNSRENGKAESSNGTQDASNQDSNLETKHSSFIADLQSNLGLQLSEAYHRILVKKASTADWHCDYKFKFSPSMESRRSDISAILPDPGGKLWFQSGMFSPIANLLGSSTDGSSLSKVVDKYNSDKSNPSIYQLSYLDSSSEEEFIDKSISGVQNFVSDYQLPDSFSFPDPSEELPVVSCQQSADNLSAALKAIQELLSSCPNSRASDSSQLVSGLIEILNSIPLFDSLAPLPYPPVDPFPLELFESRLSMEKSGLTLLNLSSTTDGDSAISPSVITKFPALVDEIASRSVRKTPPKARSSAPTSNGAGLGPFLGALFNRLGTMEYNCPYTNLLLTDLILIITSFPQPPLADVLLNHSNILMKVPVRSLFQVLASVRENLIDSLSRVKGSEQMVDIFWKYLKSAQNAPLLSVVSQSEPVNFTSDFITEDDLLLITASPSTLACYRNYGRLSSVLQTVVPSPRPTDRNCSSERTSLSSTEKTPNLRLNTVKQTPLSKSERKSISRLHRSKRSLSPSTNPPHAESDLVFLSSMQSSTRNLVYAFILFNEFCLELACLCCEHGVFHGNVLPKFERTLSLENCLAGIQIESTL